MSKYWLIFVLCGTMGACAISPAENSDSSSDSVSSSTKPNVYKGDTGALGDKGAGDTGDKAAGDKAAGDKGTGGKSDKGDGDKGCPSTPPTDFAGACKQLLAVVQANIDAAFKSGDQKQLAALKDKSVLIWNACSGPATDPGKPTEPPKPADACTQTLRELELQINAAAKAGDNALVAALKEKYSAVASSCVPSPSPSDQCAQTLKALQIEIDAAIKAGDSALVSALKDKYASVSASCANSGAGTPPPDKK